MLTNYVTMVNLSDYTCPDLTQEIDLVHQTISLTRRCMKTNPSKALNYDNVLNFLAGNKIKIIELTVNCCTSLVGDNTCRKLYVSSQTALPITHLFILVLK